MKFETISISSDDEDVPLNSYNTHANAETDSLKMHSIEQCEFCDEVFYNRYSALVHNAKHIIIPLLRQNVYQCMDCLYFFTSQKELTHHKKTKHKHEEIINNIYNENDIKHEKDIKIKSQQLHMAISDIVKKELDVKLEDYIVKNNLDVPVKVEQELETKVDDCMDENHIDLIVNEKLRNHLIAEANVKISNRLRFEDDSDSDATEIVANDAFGMQSDGLLNDLTTVCKVNLNLYDKPWVGDEFEKRNAAYEMFGNSEAAVDTKVVEIDEMSVEEYTPSTHYDDLVKPGMYGCKRCSERFPTRFQLIRHDMSHVTIRKTRALLCMFCDWFICNNNWMLLRQHVQRQHPSKVDVQRPLSFPSCKRCGLKYHNYANHIKNYHTQTSCHICKVGFDTEEEKIVHIKQHLESKCYKCGMVSTANEIREHQRLCHRVSNVSLLKLCETCCLFLKNRDNMQYAFVKSVSEVGSRLDCESCGKKFFELKLFRRVYKMKGREPMQERERKKHLSNSERLKNIQQRLKMINKLSRFSFAFYLILENFILQ